MQRFLGVFASDHRRLACAVARAWPGFPPSDPDFRGRMGLGTYGGDEVLLMRRPVGPDVRGDSWIGSACGNHALFALDDSHPGQFSPETTPPWRYRNLLGVCCLGSTPDPGLAGRLLATLPEFMSREAMRDPPEALAFRMVLSVLYDMGRLDARTIPSDALSEAVSVVLRRWPSLASADGIAAPGLVACITDGSSLVAGGAGLPVHVAHSDGFPVCPRCSEPARSRDHDPIRVAHSDLRSVVLAGGDTMPRSDAFRSLVDGAVALVDDTGAFRVRSPST